MSELTEDQKAEVEYNNACIKISEWAMSTHPGTVRMRELMKKATDEMEKANFNLINPIIEDLEKCLKKT